MRQPPRRGHAVVAGRDYRVDIPAGSADRCKEKARVLDGNDNTIVLAQLDCGESFPCPPTGDCVADIPVFGFEDESGGFELDEFIAETDGTSPIGDWLALATAVLVQICPNCEPTITVTWTPSGPGFPPEWRVAQRSVAIGPPNNGEIPAPGLLRIEYLEECDGEEFTSEAVDYIVVDTGGY